MNEYYYSVDVGGTNIKAGIVDSKGKILFCDSIKTKDRNDNKSNLAEKIFKVSKQLEEMSNLKIEKAKGLAVGLPGLVDSKKGILGFSGNLQLKNYPIKKELEKYVSIPIKIANDADIATLAEMYYGVGKKYKNFIMLTLGTGIGGGIVINNHLLAEYAPFTGEIGHMKVTNKPIKCSCGEYGCFEAVASTTALTKQTKSILRHHPESKIWEKYNLKNANGRTIFEFKDNDIFAKQLFDKYISNLGDGIVNLANIFFPDAIILGGAISNQQDNLAKPLEDYINSHIYTKNIGAKIPVLIAEETGSSGILGGKCLFN